MTTLSWSYNLDAPPPGNPNPRGFFEPDVRTFLQRWVADGPTHHFALGIGHHAETLKRIAECFDVECSVVTPHEAG